MSVTQGAGTNKEGFGRLLAGEEERAFRDRFGEYAGYAQTYMYHHARTEGLEL